VRNRSISTFPAGETLPTAMRRGQARRAVGAARFVGGTSGPPACNQQTTQPVTPTPMSGRPASPRVRGYTDRAPAVLSGTSTATDQDRDDETVGASVLDRAGGFEGTPAFGIGQPP
jgi:hypothetical protein